MPGIRDLESDAQAAALELRQEGNRRRKSERLSMNDVGQDPDDSSKENDDNESTGTPSPKPVKVKIEMIPEDEEELSEQENHGNAVAPVALDTVRKFMNSREQDVAPNGEERGRYGPENRGADDYHLAADADDAVSDEFNQQDRYSPYDAMNEKTECDDFTPIQDRDGNVVLEVDCGTNSALLYVNKLCQGSKGQCIYFEDRWYTPNEFQYISGRETAKDWKRSIRHRGKSLKILMGRGLLRAHPLMCECDTCRLNFASKGALRLGDRRALGAVVASSSSSTTGSLTAVDRARLRRSTGPDGEGGYLNDIIDQLQHSSNYGNGHLPHESRKRALGVDSMSPIATSPSSSSTGMALTIKRPRSISPREDDIYDEQQRRIFEAANSPEPQNIENLRRSLNMSNSRANSPVSIIHSGNVTATLHGISGGTRNTSAIMVASSNTNTSNSMTVDLARDQTSPPSGASLGSSGVVLLTQPQMMGKQQVKSRKQTAPQHLDISMNREEVNRGPHIVLTSCSGQTYHKVNAAIRPRYQSTPVYSHRNSGSNGTAGKQCSVSSGEALLSNNGTSSSRRTNSLMRSPGNSVKMIELTRPEIAASTSSGYSSNSRPSSAHSTSHPGEDGGVHTSAHQSSTNDAVFLPSDMASWTVADVTQFVQSLKGCEEYSQIFREQAIDGEILPVLTEDHLLHNMGLKLGPALKIRLHVARRLGFTLDGQYCGVGPPPGPSPPMSAQKSGELYVDDMH